MFSVNPPQTVSPKIIIEQAQKLYHSFAETVTRFLNEGGKPHLMTSARRPLLILAAECGNALLVDRLLKAGISVNTKDKDQNTALICASRFNHRSIVSRLLAVPEIDIDAANARKDTALECASQEGWTSIVSALFAAEKIRFEATGGFRTLSLTDSLTIAVKKNHPEIVEILLKQGADPHNFFECTPSHSTCIGETINLSLLDIAANRAATDVFILLLAAGVSIDHDYGDACKETEVAQKTKTKQFFKAVIKLDISSSATAAPESLQENNEAKLEAAYNAILCLQSALPIVKELLVYQLRQNKKEAEKARAQAEEPKIEEKEESSLDKLKALTLEPDQEKEPSESTSSNCSESTPILTGYAQKKAEGFDVLSEDKTANANKARTSPWCAQQ